MWDFTHLCVPNNLPSRASLYLFLGFDLFLLAPPCLMGLFHHQHIIHGPFIHHPWEPCVNPACSFVGTGPHILVHWNYALHGDLASLSILLFVPFSMIIFVCPLGFIPTVEGTLNTSPPLSHTILCRAYFRDHLCGPLRLALSPLGKGP